MPASDGETFAFEAEGSAGVGARRNGEFDRAFEGGNANFRAQDRLVERDREIEAQMGTLGLEKWMRGDGDADQRVSGRTAVSGQALAFQPDLLTVGQSRRYLDVDVLTGRQPHALADTLRGLGQRDRQCRSNILATVDRVEILRRARLKGYTGGKSALYDLIADQKRLADLHGGLCFDTDESGNEVGSLSYNGYFVGEPNIVELVGGVVGVREIDLSVSG